MIDLPALVPLHLSPTIQEHLAPLAARAAEEPAEASRLLQITSSLKRSSGGCVAASTWRLDDPGRVHLFQDPLQGVPKSVRHLLYPDPGWVLLAADWRSAHLTIAQKWTGDPLTNYDDYASWLNVSRATAKIALLAFINGAGAAKMNEITGNSNIHPWLCANLPGVQARWEEAKALHAAPGSYVNAPSLAGVTRPISKALHKGGWRRLLAALWTRTEADGMWWVLTHLPGEMKLCVPLYDGLLVTCREDHVALASKQLAALMQEGAWSAGVDMGAKVGWGRSWAEAEESAA